MDDEIDLTSHNVGMNPLHEVFENPKEIHIQWLNDRSCAGWNIGDRELFASRNQGLDCAMILEA